MASVTVYSSAKIDEKLGVVNDKLDDLDAKDAETDAHLDEVDGLIAGILATPPPVASNYLVLGSADSIPGGTATNTVIVRIS